jgi:hypothetical protein
MILTVEIPQPIDAKLVEKAKAAGVDVAVYAQRVLKADALLEPLDEVLASVRKSFSESSLTEDQIIEQYEAEKHAARAAKRGRPFSE